MLVKPSHSPTEDERQDETITTTAKGHPNTTGDPDLEKLKSSSGKIKENLEMIANVFAVGEAGAIPQTRADDADLTEKPESIYEMDFGPDKEMFPREAGRVPQRRAQQNETNLK
ncbi:hypothetical protein ILUMI_00473, partial [Ignelater luminosus]